MSWKENSSVFRPSWRQSRRRCARKSQKMCIRDSVCRCTGYKQIVDAVMEAAAIMRGEKTFEDITYDWSKDVGDFYGKPLIRPNAMPKACGVCDYGDDIELHMPEETLKVELVQPRKYSHAKILNIDCSEAEKMPGVFQLSLIHI